MTPAELIAARRLRATAPQGYITRPRSVNAPPPRPPGKRSMIGFGTIDHKLVELAIVTALRDGDRDPSVYTTAPVWVRQAARITLDDRHLLAVLNDPRIRAGIKPIGLAAVALAEERRGYAKADLTASATLGWRVWYWSKEDAVLYSPAQLTPWPAAELRATDYSDATALRGVSGIHALRVPLDWLRAIWPTSCGVTAVPAVRVTGIVERYGRYVLGTEGWRAEWVFIRKLQAPSTAIGLALEQLYPDVEVYYADR